MFNIEAVLSVIKSDDLVLDIGGYFQPFERANCVIDFLPYDSRKSGAGLCKEYFTKDTWVQQDVCDYTKSFPFKDKQFDFVNAGHIFEDLRDPTHALKEMVRVGKKGYVEIPSRFMEQVFELQYSNVSGFTHHRWIIDVISDKIRLIFKNHLIHTEEKYKIKKQNHSWPHINPNIGNFGFFWEGDVEVFEQESIFEDFYKDYFEETVKLSTGIPNLHDINQIAPKTINYPFKNDGNPHIIILQ